LIVQKIDVKSDLIIVNLNLKTFCKTDKLYNRLFNLQQINQTKVNYQLISISTQEQNTILAARVSRITLQ